MKRHYYVNLTDGAFDGRIFFVLEPVAEKHERLVCETMEKKEENMVKRLSYFHLSECNLNFKLIRRVFHLLTV